MNTGNKYKHAPKLIHAKTKVMKASNRLDKLAAKFNLYRADKIPAKYWNDKYFKENAPFKLGQDNLDKSPEYLTSMKGVESGTYHEVRQQTREDLKTGVVTHELYHIDHSYNLMVSEDSDLLMIYIQSWNSKGKFDLHPYFGEVRKFHAIDNDLKKKALENLKEPNKVGVFTDKKVVAWFRYCQEYVAILNTLLVEVNDKNDQLEKEREEYIAQLKEAKLIRHSDNSTVYVNWNSFQIIFNHDRKRKYMSKTVEYRGNTEDVLSLYKALNN